MNMDSPQRIRVKFGKTGDLCFIGHIDLQTLFERALRRSGLPLRYSQGFKPKARLNIASALPLGFSSHAELIDFWLDEPVLPQIILEALIKALPSGLPVYEVKEVSNSLPSLQAALRSSEFQLTFEDNENLANAKKNLDELLAKPTLPFQRRNKSVDLRPMISAAAWNGDGPLTLRLTATPGQTARPDEVLKLMGIEPEYVEIERTALFFSEE